MKMMTIDQFLTEEEIALAVKMYEESTEGFAKRFMPTIKANITRINKALGQENDPMFLAYAVEYVLSQTGQQPRKVN